VTDWNTLKDTWPIVAGLAGLWARIEVGQAINRGNIKMLMERRKEDGESLAKSFEQLRTDHKEMRAELRDEMKALRALFERNHGGKA